MVTRWDDGEPWSQPVLYWIIRSEDDVSLVTPDSTGRLRLEKPGNHWRVWHPAMTDPMTGLPFTERLVIDSHRDGL
jgi:hypothetical protein